MAVCLQRMAAQAEYTRNAEATLKGRKIYGYGAEPTPLTVGSLSGSPLFAQEVALNAPASALMKCTWLPS